MSKQSNQIRVAMGLWSLIMSRTRSDLSINIDACQPIGFSYGQACKWLEKTAAKMSKQSHLRNFLAKEMQKRTKNHPLAAVQSEISPNLLKKPAPQ